jgi:hypothetical protein
MRPQRRCRIGGSTAWVQRNADLRFTAMVRAVENVLVEVVDPAQDTDAGIVHQYIDRPEPWVTRPILPATGSRCETSAPTVKANPPRPRIAVATVSASSARSR